MTATLHFERAFAEYVGAKYAIALCNGTATLHTALAALGVGPGDTVAVPPLTMSATTIAVLHAGAVPVFRDVCGWTWLMGPAWTPDTKGAPYIPVALYGLHVRAAGAHMVLDAAQTLAPHAARAFTSYSFQASKILPLGEGGMLVTNDEALAQRAREFSSLGYRMNANGPVIHKSLIKCHGVARHHSLGWNYLMSPFVAERGLDMLYKADEFLRERRQSAAMYRAAVHGCEWLTPQHVPEGWTHDYWSYAVATDTPARAIWLLDAIERHGGKRPYPAWRLTYQEPAFRHLADDGSCPVAESLQPRLVQFQTHDQEVATRNATALLRAMDEVG